ncbi:MAG TPA: hydrogenase nickel incorporation protein HypB [Pyrinomonadaceae bacterium]|nr:hydrogenase nickel incorporation protein HypB [Acidobacteriota bacterium]HQZ96852.1 hydrogenase nickel incorporation protein HypB [Pyrinomonadaceae bacterium]
MHKIPIGEDIMGGNEETAAENRAFFDTHGLYVINLMSAPGAGKTSLLEATIRQLKDDYRIGVIEGDLVTTLDADRIAALGVPAYQITTGSVCHLDAQMVHNSLHGFDVTKFNLLIIENVGNLVCPAEFNLGEDLKVMVFSTVEGAEKPKKYPLMFHEADAVVLNKMDLLPYSGVSIEELVQNVEDVNPTAPIFPVSCRTSEGVDTWVRWLREKIEPLSLTAAAGVD